MPDRQRQIPTVHLNAKRGSLSLCLHRMRSALSRLELGSRQTNAAASDEGVAFVYSERIKCRLITGEKREFAQSKLAPSDIRARPINSPKTALVLKGLRQVIGRRCTNTSFSRLSSFLPASRRGSSLSSISHCRFSLRVL